MSHLNTHSVSCTALCSPKLDVNWGPMASCNPTSSSFLVIVVLTGGHRHSFVPPYLLPGPLIDLTLSLEKRFWGLWCRLVRILLFFHPSCAWHRCLAVHLMNAQLLFLLMCDYTAYGDRAEFRSCDSSLQAGFP